MRAWWPTTRYLKEEEDFVKAGKLVEGLQQRTPSAQEVRAVSGPAFRALRAVIQGKDKSQDYGGLHR